MTASRHHHARHGHPSGDGHSPHRARREDTDRSDLAQLTGDDARDRVFARLAEHAAALPDLDHRGLNDSGLSALDGAFAHAVYEAAVSRWITLDTLFRRGLRDSWQRLDPEVVAALIGASAQMIFLDRVPPHAAVDHAVEWVRRSGQDRGAGLVNGVLRRVAELRGAEAIKRPTYTGGAEEIPLASGEALVLLREVFPPDPVRRLSLATGHPPDEVAGWVKAHGFDAARRVALHGVTKPPIILTDPAHSSTNPGAFPEHPALARHHSPNHRLFIAHAAELGAFLREHPTLIVQDPASSRPVASLVGHISPRTILDLCAGRGTKTRQLAALFPDAIVVATDIDNERRGSLSAAFSGNDRVRIVGHAEALNSTYDLILLDVPCSNSGTLARRPEARVRLSMAQVERLTALQRDLLKAGAAHLEPGGTLLYATCSIDPRENADMARAASKHLALKLLAEELTLPAGIPGDEPAAYHDGSYFARLTN